MAFQSSGAATTMDTIEPPPVVVKGEDAPIKVISKDALKKLGIHLGSLFTNYENDRKLQELRWLRNLRQYLGYYDPEVDKTISPSRSRAYPKITRVKCISMQARIMDLMFPSDDRNWTLAARPSPDMDIKDVMMAIQAAQERDSAAGGQPPPIDNDYVQAAVNDLAATRAKQVTVMIDDQLKQLGGDQTYDYVALNDEVVESGIKYGLGTIRGPYLREDKHASWEWNPQTKQPVAKEVTSYLPYYEFLPVWNYYPDMSAKRLEDGDGYFVRQVLSRQQVRKLADRNDFFGDMIKFYLQTHATGNYKAKTYESELRTMGVKDNVNEQKADGTKYEILAWHGMVDGSMLSGAGVDIPDDKLSDHLDAEVWMIDGYVIKATLNPYAGIGEDVRTVHHFLFDKDDTGIIGFGLPNIMRDTQMAISSATRMMLDNASVICGPILEMNTNLLRSDQDLTAISAYKIFYRDDDGTSQAAPVVRNVEIESHIAELQSIIELFFKIADMETFVGPATGGDMKQMPSEPMRNAAGASMLLGNAALPFKQIVRNFDRFTQSVIFSLVQFNRAFNADRTPVSKYDVIARGATSLIAKEMRGMQIDQLAASLTPEEKMHIDERKMIAARVAVRDLDDILVSENEAARRKAAQDQNSQLMQSLQQAGIEANTRKLLADAFNKIALAGGHQMSTNATAVDTALAILEHGANLHGQQIDQPAQSQGAGVADPNPAQPGGAAVPSPGDPAGPPIDPMSAAASASAGVGLPGLAGPSAGP